MGLLTLQKFIDTHPSPGDKNNINLWITTGSVGEYIVNGITIPLLSQESELATIISQAEKLNLQEVTGLYEFTITGLNCCGNAESFDPEDLCGVDLGILDPGNDFQTVFGARENFHENYKFFTTSLLPGVPGTPLLGNNNWYRASGSADLGFSLQINDEGEVSYYVNCSNTAEEIPAFSEGQPLEFTISSRDKIISGSLYHYYLLFDKPVIMDNAVPLGATSTNFFNIFFSPTLTSIFKYNEYEVVGNDVQESRRSNSLYKVDRNSSQANPSNIISIISSSKLSAGQVVDKELFGNIQDSYYDSISWNRSRYTGTENTTSTNLLPSAYTASPIEAYVFDSQISSSQLIDAINNGTQTLPPSSTVYLYNENLPLTPSLGFTLQSSGSVVSSTDTNRVEKITVIRVDSSGVPTSSTLGGTVTVDFFSTGDFGSFSNIQRTINILADKSSGSINYDALKTTTTFGWFPWTSVTRQTFAGITGTTLADTDLQREVFKITPESRLVGVTKFLEETINKKDLIPLISKKVYDSKTKAVYELDSKGLLLEVVYY